MIAYNFRTHAGNEAGAAAIDGGAKLIPWLTGHAFGTLQQNYRAATTRIGEQQLVRLLIQATGGAFPDSLIIDYYISLKTNPFVVLTGPEGSGKTALVRTFAEVLTGSTAPRFTIIGGGDWAAGTGQTNYYRTLHERFGSIRFLEVLHEAVAPDNQGKLFFICLKALHLDELNYYFSELLHIHPDGTKRLALPGMAPEHQPIVPPNVYITAILNATDGEHQLDPRVFKHAGLITFHGGPNFTTLPPPTMLPAPVGYQRMMLTSAVRTLDDARLRLAAILGANELARLRPSDHLIRLIWHAGIPLTSRMLHECTAYVANSFDSEGKGLFDPINPFNNAQIAFDAQVAQRILWKLHVIDDQPLHTELAAYYAPTEALRLNAAAQG